MVSGAIANKCLNGGAAWTRLHYVLGLRRLGFQVFFVEQINRETCLDAEGQVTTFENSLNLAYFKQICAEFGLSGSAALVYEKGDQTYGLTYRELRDLAATADLLINISGHLTLEPVKRLLRRKVYIDLDPGFTQFWCAAGDTGAHLDGHDLYFTIGENIGSPVCPIPVGEVRWRKTRPPVVLDYWPVSTDEARKHFTTVGTWRGPYGPVQIGDKTFGLKAHEFRKFIDLPGRVDTHFEIALDIHPDEEKDLTLLRRHRWQMVDPKLAVPDPIAFRHYVQTSRAEFSVAQGIYVETKSGWVSDRTVRYLASGKPTLVQDTGFRRNYPVGEGLLDFRTLEEAIVGVEQILSDYQRHCRAARSLVTEYFDSDKVLSRLISEVGITP